MTERTIREQRPFIGSLDFAMSRAFYEALGWSVQYIDDHLALLAHGDHRFYLQAHYQKDWVENTMLHLSVDDAHAWHAHVQQVLASGSFGQARVAPPRLEPYGAWVTYVWDPAGVLLHLAQWTK